MFATLNSFVFNNIAKNVWLAQNQKDSENTILVTHNLYQFSKAKGSDKLWPGIQSLDNSLNLLDEEDKLNIIQTKGRMSTWEQKRSLCMSHPFKES